MSRPDAARGVRARIAFRRWRTSNAYELAWMAVLVAGAALATFLMRG